VFDVGAMVALPVLATMFFYVTVKHIARLYRQERLP
jgi:hypothetical protein